MQVFNAFYYLLFICAFPVRPMALTVCYYYPGHWIHFNAALTVHNFHSPGSIPCMPGIAACDNGAGKFKHNSVTSYTGMHWWLVHLILLKLIRPLKTHIRDKWVCGTETNSSSPIPDFISYHAILLNADWAGPTCKFTISKFEWSPRTCLRPQAMLACPIEPTLFAFSKTANGKELREPSLKC